MIVKFHARGKGGGSGPVDYLLGRERNREGATVLQGNPEEVRELIDATPFAKKYTSGVLSFAEKELPPGGRKKVMESFERVLMPGLEKNQYSILWVEHQDKGRLELNFVIPNMELQTGKRLQPYYDRADRPRIDAWQTLVNHHYGLHDPNAPENRRTLTLPDNLPETKQALAESVTRGLEVLYHSGEIKGRQDVIQALTEVGLEVVRVTRSSISIADPNGGRIQTNLEEIRVQEETLRKLNAKTWGVEFVQDGRRKFLVLPYGKSAEVTHYQGKDWIQLTE